MNCSEKCDSLVADNQDGTHSVSCPTVNGLKKGSEINVGLEYRKEFRA